ncbi:MAG: hypothetical protein ACRELX_03995 [Longimicrobiales bacterium]
MTADERAIVEANRLYWDTDESVAEIADQLDLSRRALYDAVQPASAGVICSRCGSELSFENRSARKAGQAVCAACGAAESVDAAAADEPRPALSVVPGDPRVDVISDTVDPDLRHRAVVLGGAAIAGVALGTVAALLATRRD